MKLEEWLPELLGELERCSHLGDRRFDTGGRFIGRLPSKGEFAWLHRLYPPLEPGDLSVLEEVVGRSIPKSFANLLKYMNGGKLFYPPSPCSATSAGSIALLLSSECSRLGSGLNQHQKAVIAARTTAERKFRASLS